ncbi:MAG TPA: hypothetical protein VGJ82_09140 [Thermoanaerobaculia bacterium]
MNWNDLNPIIFLPLAASSVILLVGWVRSGHTKRLRERLVPMAQEMGWSDVKWSRFFMAGVQGMWNGYSVRIRRVPRQKSIPERIVAGIRVQAPARILITRRQHGLFDGKPLGWFGPPVVELPLYSQFWIRTDEITLADRLMHSSAAPMLDRILQSRHDFFRLDGNQLAVQRLSATDPDEFTRLAREEWELLHIVVDTLSLRP